MRLSNFTPALARTLALPLALATAFAPATATVASAGPGVQIEDRVDILQTNRRLIAVDAEGRPVSELDLELGEEVVAIGSEGRLGVASTSTRLLGFRSGSPGWVELRYRISERPTEQLYLEERVVLVTLPDRIVALTASSKSWLELALSPGERTERVLSDSNLGAVVTSRRAIALSDRTAFVEIGLSPREQVETSSTSDSSISLVTQRRMLVYRAGSARWIELPRLLSE